MAEWVNLPHLPAILVVEHARDIIVGVGDLRHLAHAVEGLRRARSSGLAGTGGLGVGVVAGVGAVLVAVIRG